jgi:hypothetical protein
VTRTPRRLGLPRATAAAIAAALMAAGGLGAITVSHALGGGATSVQPAPATGLELIHGAPLQRASCVNWLAATPTERSLASRSLAASVGAPTEYGGVRGTALTRAETYQLLDNGCSSRIARNFLLYEMYIRAAAFHSMWARP